MKSKQLAKYLSAWSAVFSLALAGTASADFDPIPLTPGSYNADVIVEKTAPPPMLALGNVTVTMDAGTAITGNTWYEQGVNPAALATGLPVAGSTITHAQDVNKTYRMPATYAGNCTVFISNQAATGTMTLTSPTAVTSLSFLSSSGNGPANINYVITFADSTTESGSISSLDWFNAAPAAFVAAGRVNAAAATPVFNDVNSVNPRLHSQEITVVSTQPVTKVDLTYTSGGRASIFALSGLVSGTWTPLTFTGYNHDAVIGVTEASFGALTTATTASMDGGLANTGNTWYEAGYVRGAPTTGLPTAGTVITSSALADHHYLMPASYSAPNAIYVDQAHPNATMTLAAPLNYTALSFLNSTANGFVNVECTMRYQDGSSEVQQFQALDWFNNTPFAYNAKGRVNLGNRSLNNLNGTNPRLYEAQFVLNNRVSPIVSVDLRWLSAANPTTGRAVILAVSATAGALKPVYGNLPQPVNLFDGGSATFSATISGGDAPMTFQWQKDVGGTFTNLSNGGNIAGATTLSLNVNPATAADQTQYRLVTTNAAGPTITPPVALTVLSALPDITAPADAITAFGGTSPVGEEVVHAIDNVIQKYLNFGANAVPPPYVGPVGFTVTPVAGPTIVKGIRIFTANDTPARDPADFALEGSNDGGANWSPIATGPLALPEGRNGTGAVAVNPLTQFLQQVLFSNTLAYTSYRVTFVSVKDPGAANSMQVGEVELLGTVPPGTLTIEDAGDGQFLLRSTSPAILQSDSDLIAPWTDLGAISPAAPYLYVPTAGERRKYFQLKP